MRIYNLFPVGQLVGAVRNSGLVFFKRHGDNFARANTRPSNPQSEDQVKMRAYMTAATKHWYTLSVLQRQAWQDYADQYFSTDADGFTVTPSGIGTYVRANSVRQVMGLALNDVAPVLAPPAPLTSIVQLADVPDVLALDIFHSYTVITGLSVIVRATAAMPTVAVKPRPDNYRYVRGVSPNSAQPLVASGGSLSFSPTRYIIGAGERFGVETRVVRNADGIMSNPLFGDFIKIV